MSSPRPSAPEIMEASFASPPRTRGPKTARFAPGTTLAGKYVIDRVLSESAVSLVLSATDAERGRPVALKVLRAEWRTPDLEARFEREARLAARLAGEHVARILGSGHTDKGDAFLVMELLSGRDLAAELSARGPLPVAEAVDLVLEACAGVAEAHAASLVHRALKPANLFVSRGRLVGGDPRTPSPPSSIKVLDFGLTKVAHEKGQMDLSANSSDFGTPQYMAPEQIRGARPVDARADQHALGAVLHELLAGAPPFTAPSVTQLAVAIAVAPPPPLRTIRPDIPRAVEAAVRRALAKAPGDRFPDLLGLAEAVAPAGDERSRRALAAVRAALR